jgi:glycosyltransferase involved in cell wall biosynthesis
MSLKKNVLIVNQSAELYGADKALLELIENFPVNFNPIVVLHEEGPLKVILEKMNVQVIKTSVIKVKRGILKPSFFVTLPYDTIKSFIKIKRELKGKKIDLIHSNATSVFIGAFYGFFFRIPHLWHVHEIIEKPRKVAQVYPYLINFFSNKVVFNSLATSNHFTTILPKIGLKSTIIHNGQDRKTIKTSEADVKKIKENCSSDIEGKVVIGLIGRISKIKGQHLALDAFSNLLKRHKNIHLVFVGSYVKGKEEYIERIYKKIKDLNLEKDISFVDFQENIWPYYDSIDIAIVPSTEKESFGLVATEAMLSKKPVIAANHGGLSEIILNNETGFFFEPNNCEDLCIQLEKLIINKDLRISFGENGLKRVKDNFSSQKYVSSIESIYFELTN